MPAAVAMRLSLYWLYDLPPFVGGVLVVGAFLAFGLAGLYATRRWVRRLHRIDHSHNDIVGYFLAAITVFYGITLGLVAVGTWETYTDVENRVEHEAVAIGALYRDVGAYPEPERTMLENDLRAYVRQVVDVGWPMQQRGVVPNNASGALDDFQAHFMAFEPKTERQKIVAAEAYRAFNDLTESRRARLNSVTAEIPGPVWLMVVAGAMLSLATSWFFDTESFAMHFWMTVVFSVLTGLLIYLIVSLDNPYRGKLSVSAEPIERVYEQIMAR